MTKEQALQDYYRLMQIASDNSSPRIYNLIQEYALKLANEIVRVYKITGKEIRTGILED